MLIAKHPDHLISREKFHFHSIRQVRNFPRQLQLPPYGVNMPLLLPTPHIYVLTRVSPADSHRIPSGAPNMLQTSAGLTSIITDTSTSIPLLLHIHRSASPHLPTSSISHLRCDILSPLTPAFLYTSRFSSDRTVPHCHVLTSRFTSTRTHTRLMPLAKRNSQHITRAQCPPSPPYVNKYHHLWLI